MQEDDSSSSSATTTPKFLPAQNLSILHSWNPVLIFIKPYYTLVFIGSLFFSGGYFSVPVT